MPHRMSEAEHRAGAIRISADETRLHEGVPAKVWMLAAAPLELKELNKLAMRSPSQEARLRPFQSSSRLSCGRRAVEANHHNSKAKAMVIMMAMTT